MPSEEDSPDSHSDSSDTPVNEKRQKSTNATYHPISSEKESSAQKVAIALARVLLGLSSRNQVLNRSTITKIIEAENEKGSSLQFKKNILPVLSQLLADIFRYGIVELPSKKHSAKPPAQSQVQSQATQAKAVVSDEFVLVNNLPPSLRALNYTFMADRTAPITRSVKEMDKPKQDQPLTSVYGEGLPRPTNMVVQNGVTLLILCTVLLHGNNILQSDLITILRTKFGLSFREKEQVSILGDQTLTEFLAMLGKQEYIERILIAPAASTGSPATDRRAVNSKTARHDDNTLVIRLGRRCLAEWTTEEFVNLFRQIMQDQWTDQLQESAIFTVSSVWK